MAGYTGGLEANQPSFLTTDRQEYSNANYLGSDAIAQGLQHYKPEVDEQMYERYGNQEMTGLMSLVPGYTQAKKSRQEYFHFEEDFIRGVIFFEAHAAGGGAGQSVDLTLSSAAGKEATEDISYNLSPYISTGTYTGVMPQKYDVLQLPGADRMEVLVTNVNTATGVVTVYPKDGSDTIPQILVTDEVIIKGSNVNEGSSQGKTTNSRYIVYKNNMFRHRRDYSITGTEFGEQTWVTLTGKDGKKGKVWFLKGFSDTYKRFMSEREFMLFDGKQISNAALANVAGFETVTGTEGLLTTVESAGHVSGYTDGGLALSDLNDMARSFDKYKGQRTNVIVAGYDFRSELNKLARDGDGVDFGTEHSPSRVQLTNGGIEDHALNLDFSSMKFNEYKFLVKQTNAFSSPDAMGAAGQEYIDYGVVIPMGSKVVYNDLNDKSSSTLSKTICMNYKVDGNGKSRAYLEWTSGFGNGAATSGDDKFNVHVLCEVGFELVAANQFGLFKTV